jgi:hypothetical protein
MLPGYNGKDRTFWSFNYEGVRQTIENVSQAFWFPEEFRRGDFSALLTPLIRDGRPVRAPIIIHDPLTGEERAELHQYLSAAATVPAGRYSGYECHWERTVYSGSESILRTIRS